MPNLKTCNGGFSNGVLAQGWGAAASPVAGEDRSGLGKRHDEPEIMQKPVLADGDNDEVGQAEIQKLPIRPELTPAPENANK